MTHSIQTQKPKKELRLLITHSILHLPVLLFIIVFLAIFTLYISTLAPGVVGGDAGEHQFAVPLLGIPHTTGYPLYILVAKAWTLLIPFGSMAWRVNLFSALGGALAAATTTLLVYHLSISLAGQNNDRYYATWPGALVAGIALALGLTLWQWSVIAGVRSFNVFFFALLTLEAVIWGQQRQRNDIQSAERTLYWLALTVGLSLAHHRTTIFYLPSLALWVLWSDRQLIRQPQRILSLVLLTLAPLLLYLFIYLRGINNPAYTHEPIYDLQSFWFLVGSGDSQGLFFAIDPIYLTDRLNFIWHDMLNQLSWPGVILVIIGAISLLWRGSTHFVFQGVLVLLLFLFTLDFEVVNLREAPTWYLMPAYFIFALWLGLGINAILDFGFWILRLCSAQVYDLRFKSRPTPYQFIIQITATVAFTLLLFYSLGQPNWQKQYTQAVAPLDDWRQLLRGTQAQRFVESSLPYVKPDSIIWADWEQYTPIRYYQFMNNLRNDVTPRNPLNNWPEKVAVAHKSGQPIYFARKPADLIGTPYLSMVGSLIYIGTQPQFEVPPDITPLEVNFEDELELIGYRSQIYPQNRGVASKIGAASILQITFYWRVPQKVAWDYALSLRLIDAQRQEVYKKDAAHPVLSSYPTTLWTPGEIVGDFYELPLPPQAGPLSLHIIPYRTEGENQWHNLTLNNTNPPQEGLLLGPF